MERLFSTEDVHRRERFSYWHEVACRNLVPHEATPDNRLGFDATMSAGKIAALDVVLFENSAMSVSRTRTHCRRCEDDDLFFCQQLQGKLEIQQSGRESILSKGDMVLLDPVLPYSGTFHSGSKLLVLKLRRQDLRARLGETDIFIGMPLASQGIESSLTSEFVSTLPQWTGKVCLPTGEIMQTYCVDLIATTIGKLTDKQGTHISSTRASALMAVRMAIEVRLQDPSLSPQKIAAAAGITARYANLLLAREGTSLSRLLLSRRLNRCRKTLGDPSQGHRTISDIAYGWGFSDMTHFSRTFKTAFGILPSGYRRMAAESLSAER